MRIVTHRPNDVRQAFQPDPRNEVSLKELTDASRQSANQRGRINSSVLDWAAVAVAVALVLSGGVTYATPPSDGLTLWLDAGDTATLTKDAGGYVSCWADRSGQSNHACQKLTARQPQHKLGTLGHRDVLRFDGDDRLNLGQPGSLNFAPGDPFTIAVVYRVAAGKSGTFLAKGGGAANQRAYQFYVTSQRLGAITYGVMRESPPADRTTQMSVALLVCHGSASDIYANGRLSFSSTAARGTSEVDVLIGCRRKNADNTETYYPLSGDMAEMLVYRRALNEAELSQLHEHLAKKHGVGAASLAMPDTPEALAERLWHLAEQNRLSDTQAAAAAKLLGHDDPFVRGMAEWAIALKVGAENNGQDIVWPRSQNPAWFETWCDIGSHVCIELDWVRQALCADLHHNSQDLLTSVDGMIARAARTTADSEWDSAPLEALRATRLDLAARLVSEPADVAGHRRLWIRARRSLRELVLADGAVKLDHIGFVKHFAPHTTRNITRTFSWQHKPGGDLCVLDVSDPGSRPSGILQGQLGAGHVRSFDLCWEADRVVFAHARQPHWPPVADTTKADIEGRSAFELRRQHEPLCLYEINLDGTGLQQLTDHPYFNDFEPAYLANGDVVFASDRCGRSAECGPFEYDIANCNLYVIERDGKRIRHLTDNKDLDRHPRCLDNGDIAYTHWEYQERHFMEVHSLWTVRPDGTMSQALFKHHMKAPLGLRDTRSIPGSTRLVSIATGHHTFAHGPVVIVDPRHGLNADAGIRIVTPGVNPQEGGMTGRPVAEGGVADHGGLYHTPWALSEKSFLVSYSYRREQCTAPLGADSNGFGVYLVDVYGNKELLHRDSVYSCTSPAPLRRRPRPPIVRHDMHQADGEATCVVTDVYEGMSGVPRGTIKYIRVAQHVGWPMDQKHGMMPLFPDKSYQNQFGYWSWSPVRVIGDVPTESDGSASFKVPADTSLYFQALDERHMEVRRMRSLVSFKAGEVRGCRGCHESQARAPVSAGRSLLALQQTPRTPTPPPWGAGKLLGYEWLVQPVLDRHCVRCHGSKDPDGGLDFTATRADDGFLQSFRTMFGAGPGQKAGRQLVACANRFGGAEVSQPKQFGSHKSPLIETLLDDELHRKEAQLSPADWYALVTWIDANAPYYDRFVNKRPDDGGEPRRNVAAN